TAVLMCSLGFFPETARVLLYVTLLSCHTRFITQKKAPAKGASVSYRKFPVFFFRTRFSPVTPGSLYKKRLPQREPRFLTGNFPFSSLRHASLLSHPTLYSTKGSCKGSLGFL